MSSSQSASNVAGSSVSAGTSKASERIADTLRMMKELKIKEEKAVMSKKKESVKPSGQEAVQLASNVFGIKARNSIVVYRYDLSITQVTPRFDGNERVFYLTKKSGGDASLHDLHEKCRVVFNRLRQDHKPLKGTRCLYYDLQSIVFSLDKLDIGSGKETKITLQLEDLPQELFPPSGRIEVVISPVKNGFETNLQDLSGISCDLEVVERSLLQFYDIATSQKIMFTEEGEESDHVAFSSHRSYLMAPGKYGFVEKPSWLYPENSSYLAVGVDKGVHCIEGGDKSKQLGLVVQTKKTPFHRYEPLLDKINQILNRKVTGADEIGVGERNRIDAFIKGIEVETTHLRRRYGLKKLSYQTARSHSIEVGEANTFIVDYFRSHHNIELSHPNLPLVVTKDRGCELPIELCMVCDSQRVNSEQQTSNCVQAMIRDCAVPPIEHLRQNEQTYKSLQLQNNRYLDEAGIEVSPYRMDLEGRMLMTPSLLYAQNRMSRVNMERCTWTAPAPYLVSGQCKKIAAFAFLGSRDNMSPNDFDNFLRRLIETARRRGVMVPPEPCNARDHPKDRIMRADKDRINEAISKMSSNGVDFIIVVHGDLDNETHAYVKLMEHRYSVQTQCFRVGTLMKVVRSGQPATLENMVNKTNMKLHGINYSLELKDPVAKEIIGSDMLIIGVAINHPSSGLGGRGSENIKSDSGTVSEAEKKQKSPHPSIVGYSANIGSNPFEFVGDFIMQRYTGEVDIGSVVPSIVGQCMELYKKHRGRLPGRVLFYHNGASEGWFANLLRCEVPLIRYELKKAGSVNAKITLIVSNRLQPVRLFNKHINQNAKPPEQNIKPGVFVDHTIVHGEFAEFFLNSHRALQGTTRVPKYTVLIDENGFSMDHIARMTYYLSYGHQIVYMPTSLPSPVYIANQYAERGRKLFLQWIQENTFGEDGYERVTDEIAYRGKKTLRNHRLNA